LPNKEGTQHRQDGVMRPFDQASLVEFVRRADGPPEAVSGVCTHQGCRAVFRPIWWPVALPVSWGVVLADRAATVSSGTDSTGTVAALRNSWCQRRCRGVRPRRTDV